VKEDEKSSKKTQENSQFLTEIIYVQIKLLVTIILLDIPLQ